MQFLEYKLSFGDQIFMLITMAQTVFEIFSVLIKIIQSEIIRGARLIVEAKQDEPKRF